MALIQLDLVPGSGDQLLTYDDQTNLEWLNLTATANRSYYEVVAGFGGFVGIHGFTYGDAGQVGTLFKNAGITKGVSEPPFQSSPNDMVNHFGIQTLSFFMNGRTFSAGTSPIHSKIETRGIIKPPHGPPTDANASLDVFVTSLNMITPVNSHVDSLPLIKPGQQVPSIGSYLVRLHA